MTKHFIWNTGGWNLFHRPYFEAHSRKHKMYDTRVYTTCFTALTEIYVHSYIHIYLRAYWLFLYIYYSQRLQNKITQFHKRQSLMQSSMHLKRSVEALKFVYHSLYRQNLIPFLYLIKVQFPVVFSSCLSFIVIYIHIMYDSSERNVYLTTGSLMAFFSQKCS